MNSVACAPIILCRTKHVDYREGLYVYPEELDKQLISKIVQIMNNGKSLGKVPYGKIFINDGTHCILGKYARLNTIVEKELDFTLDGKNGRCAWGFLGGVVRFEDFCSLPNPVDLPDDYYTDIYVRYYQEHWLDKEPVSGPYRYPYQSVGFKVMDDDGFDFSSLIWDKKYILEDDSQNDLLFAYAEHYAREGKKIAFCSNAEYNAHQLIREGIVQIATASPDMLRILENELLKGNLSEKKIAESEQNIVEGGQQKTNKNNRQAEKLISDQQSFYEAAEKERSFCLGKFKIGFRIENSDSLFKINLGQYCFFLEKKDKSISQETKQIRFTDAAGCNSICKKQKKDNFSNKYKL